MQENIYLQLSTLIEEKKMGAICTLTRVFGSSPRKEGTKMIVLEDGSIIGTIGGGSLEYRVIDEAKKAIEENKTRYLSYVLEKDLGMKCGGSLEVYIEPFGKKPKLFIFGAGHVGNNLMKIAPNYGFEVILIDGRENIFNSLSLNKDVTFIQNDPLKTIPELDIDNKSYLVLVSHNHLLDEQILREVVKLPHLYLGMIGSSAKIKKIRENLIKSGTSEEKLKTVDMPIGIQFNAETPEEIVISILAKLIDVKNS